MKKFVLFLSFVLCFAFTSSVCLAELVLEKNADGSYLIFEKPLGQNIPPLPPDINLSDKVIIKLFTEGGVEEYPVEEIKLTTLFPLPLVETMTTNYSVSFHKEEKWITTPQEPEILEEIDYILLPLLIFIFIAIPAKTIISSAKGEVKLKEKILIDFIIFSITSVLMLIITISIGVSTPVAAGTAFSVVIGTVLMLAVGTSIALKTGIKIKEATALSVLATIIATVTVTAIIGNISDLGFILQYLAFLLCIILAPYFVLHLRNKKEKTQIEKNSIQC